jgi:hypothetical protein
VLRWAGVVCLGYITALWITSVIFWVEIILVLGIQYMMTGFTYVLFFNSVVILTLVEIFAFVGLVPLIRIGNQSSFIKKMSSLSLILIGTHFVIYLLYAAFTANLTFALSFDIWLIPVLGLGLSLLKEQIPKVNLCARDD